MILNLRSLLSAPRGQLATQIGQSPANHWRSAEEDANSPPALGILGKEFNHLLVVLVQNVGKVGSAKVRGTNKAGVWRHGGRRRTVLFKQKSINVLGDIGDPLRQVIMQIDGKMRIVRWSSNIVQQVGKPKKVVLVAHDLHVVSCGIQ